MTLLKLTCPYSVLLGLVITIGGCATHLTAQQLATADYGELSPRYQEAIQTSMQTMFYDPESARYRYEKPPVKGYAYVHESNNPPEFGYLVDVQINAKNRLGGYTGEDEYTFLVKGNTAWLVRWWMTSGRAK